MSVRFLRLYAIAALAVGLLCLMVPSPGWAADPPPSAAQLADLLENEETRKALIEQLRQSATETPAAAAATETATPSLPQRLAALTRSVATRSVGETTAAFRALSSARERVQEMGLAALGTEIALFSLFVLSVLVVFWILQRSVTGLYARLDRFALATADSLARRIVAVLGAIGVHLATVVLAWLAGYAIALFMPGVGESGEIRVQESLFLNAFLVVEGTRMVLAAILSPRFAGLRLVPAGEESAYWHAWASRMAYFLGYGLLLVAPAASQLLAPEVGRILSLAIMLVAFLMATAIILQNRLRVRHSLESLAGRMQTGFARVALVMIARIWHIVAVFYIAALLVSALFYADHALGFMLAATAQSLIASLVGVALASLLGSVIMRRIRLPQETCERFPLLEDRLNAYVPTMLKVARFAILAVVAAVILDAWTTFDLMTWAGSERGMSVIGKIVTVGLIIGLALFGWLLAASWIEYRLNPSVGNGEPTPRVKTLLTIFRNAIAIALVVLTTMVVLAELGVNIGPLIAGAGVLGLAIGFGSQKLVQDVITGLFIQLEGAINVGDVVTAGGTTGTVEKLTIRSLGMRDLSGTYHLMPFSTVDMVSNFNREFGYHVGEYGVAYREDTDEVIEHLKAAFEELRADPAHGPNILADLEVHGVTALADSSVNVRVRIRTLPGTQFATGRAYNRLVKRHFDAAGIEIPFPHMTLYFGEDKQGKAPPANLRIVGTPTPAEEAK
ncbi:MAG: mechanosensitive ion channel [Zoogloeaceae bacterium]|nr:mechanosensitive ion channel [Zoogloeaceae bacterium]